VQVATTDGVVTLTGSVRSQEIQERMGIVSRAVGSVVSVDNRLDVDRDAPDGDITLETTVERAISDRVRLALQNDSMLVNEEPSIGIKTKKNVVTLRGFVSSAAARERAEVVAKAVGSVDRVDNRLVVRED
jgi:osmotically-inducible protein OsmY